MCCLDHLVRLARLKYEMLWFVSFLFFFFSFSERYPDLKFKVFESI